MSDTTSYLLRDIPKDFWGKVRNLSYQEGISIKDLIMEALEDALKKEELEDAAKRKKCRKKTNQAFKGKSPSA